MVYLIIGIVLFLLLGGRVRTARYVAHPGRRPDIPPHGLDKEHRG